MDLPPRKPDINPRLSVTTERMPARNRTFESISFQRRVSCEPDLQRSSRPGGSLIPPAMQDGKQRFWARLQLLVRLTLNTPNYAANEPARLAQLDDGKDRAILIQGDEGPAQSLPWRKPGSFAWASRHLHRLDQRRSCHFLVVRPVASFGPRPDGRNLGGEACVQLATTAQEADHSL